MYDDAILFTLPAIKAKNYICFDIVVYNYFIGRADQSANLERIPKNIVARAKQAIYLNEFWCDNKPKDLDERVDDGITY